MREFTEEEKVVIRKRIIEELGEAIDKFNNDGSRLLLITLLKAITRIDGYIVKFDCTDDFFIRENKRFNKEQIKIEQESLNKDKFVIFINERNDGRLYFCYNERFLKTIGAEVENDV